MNATAIFIYLAGDQLSKFNGFAAGPRLSKKRLLSFFTVFSRAVISHHPLLLAQPLVKKPEKPQGPPSFYKKDDDPGDHFNACPSCRISTRRSKARNHRVVAALHPEVKGANTIIFWAVTIGLYVQDGDGWPPVGYVPARRAGQRGAQWRRKAGWSHQVGRCI